MAKLGPPYTYEVADGVEAQDGRPSIGKTFKSIYAKEGVPALKNIETCWDMFSVSAKRNPDRNMLGVRKIMADGKAGEYVWQTYKQVLDKVTKLGSAMRHVGVNPKDRAGIYGANTPEWFMSMEACNSQSVLCVPLYDTLGAEAVEYIIGHAEVSIVFVQDLKIPLMIQSLGKAKEFIKTFVSFGEIPEDQRAQIEAHGLAAYSWNQFLDLGEKNVCEFCPPKGEDICTIMYTSGTTGEPKGVLIKHESIVDLNTATEHFLNKLGEKLDENDIFFSFLPLAHIMDRCLEEYFVYIGASIGFWRGDVKLLTEDIAALKPTFFAGVPRVFDRIYTGLNAKIVAAGGIKKLLFDFGYKMKLKNIKNGKPQEKAAPLFDLLVFNKVKVGLGGGVRLILSGAAPLASHVEEFLRTTMCAPCIQGYGLTETCAGSFISLPNIISMQGTVGPPMPNIEARLESVPEMNYEALPKDPNTPARGEVCIRGKTVFAGYHKRPDLTEEALTSDGWFHTGDIGEWQKDGALKIIDRKKNIFKLSQGEYVAVENLENVYGLCHPVESIWVYGNSFESSLVAVVVPKRDVLEHWAAANGIQGSFEEICNNSEAKQFILKELGTTAKSSKLKGFEVIRGVHLEPEPFDVERDLLTPTYKKKRPQLLKHYEAVIAELYKGCRQ
ncbi:long-chain acyl-CoA synthetase [Marchantia polymorpha subsp. ruderalis]|uniref:Long-chain-fatty-acid--CoA ligase n=2 Tax=Marchantia polymorpha TaxID=3197 RepID=A0AAF6BV11_MARPO|nr:hypothetical protein MARPO_0099s0012 [Marchantia polymorpha]BBN15845.1 hypothetical protein Mp_7g01380 [Marchantia polymorpha subsp. ruderalis]|eukprot:PTQ32373.1 hypothetical protein MARPO_0099s0012 [Marchantia polymorpha]